MRFRVFRMETVLMPTAASLPTLNAAALTGPRSNRRRRLWGSASIALLAGLLPFFTIAPLPTVAYSQASNAFHRAAESLPQIETGKPIDQDINPANVVIWSGVDSQPISDHQLKATLRLSTKDGFTVYKDNLKFKGPKGLQVAKIDAPPTRLQYDPISRQDVEVYHQGDFTLHFEGLLPKAGEQLPVSVTFVGCTHKICLFPHTTTVPLTIYSEDAVATAEVQPTTFDQAAGNIGPQTSTEATTDVLPNTDTQTIVTNDQVPEPIGGASAASFEDRWAKQLTSGGLAFATLILVVFAGGLLSNLTPCVYPMVPITLRLLARQASSPYIGASVYALGIVVTYSSLGLVAALGGGLFGSLLASTTFNVVFATLMILLGISMLGFGDFSKLQNFGNKLGAGQPSLRNTFLMGTGAGLVAAPCTGPILAALLAYTAKNGSDVGSAIILLGTYSFGFALPYVVLGGAAAKISAIKVSPAIQVSTKLIFASVMFALGLYYLRIPFYGLLKAATPYWSILASIGTALGVTLTALWLWRPGLSTAKASTLVPTLTLAMGLFATSQWLTDGSSAKAMTGLKWYKSETAATQASQSSGKPILVDMWAEWCEACKKMDATTFVDDQIVATLGQDWVLLKLDLTEDNEANDAIQDRFELQSLPTLVMLPPGGDIAGKKSLTGYIGAESLGQSLRDFTDGAD